MKKRTKMLKLMIWNLLGFMIGTQSDGNKSIPERGRERVTKLKLLLTDKEIETLLIQLHR